MNFESSIERCALVVLDLQELFTRPTGLFENLEAEITTIEDIKKDCKTDQ